MESKQPPHLFIGALHIYRSTASVYGAVTLWQDASAAPTDDNKLSKRQAAYLSTDAQESGMDLMAARGMTANGIGAHRPCMAAGSQARPGQARPSAIGHDRPAVDADTHRLALQVAAARPKAAPMNLRLSRRYQTHQTHSCRLVAATRRPKNGVNSRKASLTRKSRAGGAAKRMIPSGRTCLAMSR